MFNFKAHESDSLEFQPIQAAIVLYKTIIGSWSSEFLLGYKF
jgi:hypothetical protein